MWIWNRLPHQIIDEINFRALAVHLSFGMESPWHSGARGFLMTMSRSVFDEVYCGKAGAAPLWRLPAGLFPAPEIEILAL
ncbi:hypothetical protein VXQ18_10170 [Brucella abortus]|nr:hypothetical protein [Brucella abortus]